MEFLPIIIDIVLVFILISSIFSGRKKGFVRMALSIAAAVISMIVAYEFAPTVAAWIEESLVREPMTNAIADSISANIGSGAEAIADAIPAYIMKAAELAGANIESFLSGINSPESVSNAAEQIYAVIKDGGIIPAANVLGFFAIYVISNTILSSVVITAINNIFKLPILKGINKLLGGILGGIKGVIVVCIISLVLSAATMLFKTDNDLLKAIDSSTVISTVVSIINT